MDWEEARNMITAMTLRLRNLRTDGRLQNVVVFKNKGIRAGASIDHCHGQIIATPIVPERDYQRGKNLADVFERKGQCGYCYLVNLERDQGVRMILETDHHVGFVPYAGQGPYMMTIAPKAHAPWFEYSTPEQLDDFTMILRNVMGRLAAVFGGRTPDYNWYLQNTPINGGLAEYPEHLGHWTFWVEPCLTTPAGLEKQSGVYINPTPPEIAAAYLREAAPLDKLVDESHPA
jgi:UDPglucose--hexose-1-phosphate uridylyltransferase